MRGKDGKLQMLFKIDIKKLSFPETVLCYHITNFNFKYDFLNHIIFLPLFEQFYNSDLTLMQAADNIHNNMILIMVV